MLCLILAQAAWQLESGLSKSVSIRADAEPVHVAVQRISDATGVALRASASVAQDRIVLFARNVPAAELMERIAKHFDWAWRRTKDGIELWQTPEQVNAERKALDQQILEPLRPWRKDAIDACQDRRKIDPARESLRLSEQFEALEQHERTLDEAWGERSRERWAWGNKRSEMEYEIEGTARKISPMWVLADLVVASLSDRDLLDLDSNGQLIYAYAPTVGQRRMPTEARRATERLVTALATTAFRDSGIIEREQRSMGLNMPELLRPEDVLNVRVHLRRTGENPATVQVIIVDRRLQVPWSSDLSRRELPFHLRPPAPPDPPKDALDQRLEISAALREAARPEVSGRMHASEQAERDFLVRGGATFLSRGSAIVMNEIASTAKLSLIADCYDFRHPMSSGPPPLNTVRAGLKFLTWEHREAFDGKWVTFQDKSRALHRAKTVPSDKLLLVRDLVLGGYNLDAATKAIRLLTDRQTTSQTIGRLFGQHWIISSYDCLPLLRLWGDLSHAQRELAQKTGVAFSHLSPKQMEFGMRFARDAQPNTQARNLSAIWDAEDTAWVSAMWPARREGKTDRELTQLFPNGPPRDGVLLVRLSTTDGIMFSARDSNWTSKRGVAETLAGGYFNPDKDKYRIQFVPEHRAFFHLAFSPDVVRGKLISGFGLPKGKLYERIGDLPEDLRIKLDLVFKEMNER